MNFVRATEEGVYNNAACTSITFGRLMTVGTEPSTRSWPGDQDKTNWIYVYRRGIPPYLTGVLVQM